MVLRDVIICLGDSLTWGSRDERAEGRGYPPILAGMLYRNTGKASICLNKGVTRETSTDVLRRAYDTIRGYPEAQLVLLLAGTNDLKGNPDGDLYRENMRQIIECARVCGKRVLVGTLPPVTTMGMWCFPNNVMDGVKYYNEIITGLGCPVVDFSDMLNYLADGVHLNHSGYKEMAVRWYEGIRTLI